MPLDVERCTPKVMERFWSKVDKDGECWTWTAARDKKGYGFFNPYPGFQMKAHRFIDRINNGPHKSTQEFTLHHCDNPSCVRPSHLFRGTAKDNAIDCRRKGRHSRNRGVDNPIAKLTPDDVRSIRKLVRAGNSWAKTGQMFGVTKAAVQDIIRGKTWSHVKD